MTFIGHFYPEALAAVGLSLVFKYVIADSVMFGMNTALETLAA